MTNKPEKNPVAEFMQPASVKLSFIFIRALWAATMFCITAVIRVIGALARIVLRIK